MKKETIFIPEHYKGLQLLNHPDLNKGTGFSQQERDDLALHGLIPNKIETLDIQTQRMYEFYQTHNSPLEKHLMLKQILSRNKTLFFNIIYENLEEMIPIIYTPTIGKIVKTFPNHTVPKNSLYLNFKQKHIFENIVKNIENRNIDLIIITDGESVLGIGDQGIAGIDICIAKSIVYSLCGGISPYRTLPVIIDVGTNNPAMLENEFYQGEKCQRIDGEEYFATIDAAIKSLTKTFPNALIHWEDFGRNNAEILLKKYQTQFANFNDDTQGTGAAALATIKAACKANNTTISKQTFLIYGAGTAGIGIADCITQALMNLNITEQEAKDKIWLIDKPGLITHDIKNLTKGQKRYAKPSHFKFSHKPLHQTIKAAKPNILIGCSAVKGAFDQAAVELMLEYEKNPIILPLSNPNDKAEAHPQKLIYWSKGQARVATGSPFAPVDFHGQGFVISQCNNALIFPGIGLGCTIAKPKYITESMITATSDCLSNHNNQPYTIGSALLPTWSSIHETSISIALAIANTAHQEGLCSHTLTYDEIKKSMWQPHYPTLIKKPDISAPKL
jgi:malate dehydrogenase (oxaloacetate-decarboxylating)